MEIDWKDKVWVVNPTGYEHMRPKVCDSEACADETCDFNDPPAPQPQFTPADYEQSLGRMKLGTQGQAVKITVIDMGPPVFPVRSVRGDQFCDLSVPYANDGWYKCADGYCLVMLDEAGEPRWQRWHSDGPEDTKGLGVYGEDRWPVRAVVGSSRSATEVLIKPEKRGWYITTGGSYAYVTDRSDRDDRGDEDGYGERMKGEPSWILMKHERPQPDYVFGEQEYHSRRQCHGGERKDTCACELCKSWIDLNDSYERETDDRRKRFLWRAMAILRDARVENR